MGSFSSKSQKGQIKSKNNLSKYIEFKSLKNNKLYFTKRSDLELLKTNDRRRMSTEESSPRQNKTTIKQLHSHQKAVRCQVLN
ncbi:unnamed protein product [Blepharisma stoltei]|uniref:Uncharacterized protein n=1 Tax=Blepharisma stoltei TaxID=1481888 RepID=A0AAU9JAE4_9CILI|nr:unnamed protein product [Blepharisma stoltei]